MEEYKTPEERNAAVFYLLGDNASFRAWTLPAAFLDAVRRGARLGDLGKLPLRTHRRAWLHFSLRDASGVELERLPVPLNLSNVALFSHTEPLQLHNILFFADIPALRKAPWFVKKHGPADERRHALFILPAFGSLQDGDYLLIQADEANLEIKAPADALKSIKRVDSSVVTELQTPHPIAVL